MSILDKLFRRKPNVKHRFFKGAVVNDLLADWIRQLRGINEDLSHGVLERLWARSIDLYQNNPYFRRYVQLVQQNVLGANGFTLRVKVYPVTISQEGAREYGNRVRDAFLDWVTKADVDGNTWYITQRLVMNSLLIFGEAFVIFTQKNNEEVFQVVSPTACPPINGKANIGKKTYDIRMGMAYHGKESKPQFYRFVTDAKEEIFVPASNVLHIYVKEFPEQLRGYPPAASILVQMHHLSGYEEAELIASRLSAAKMGFYVTTGPTEIFGEVEEDGTFVEEVQPGVFVRLPKGVDVKTFDTQHPKTSFPEFQKAVLRSIASGLGVSYVALANDLESTNYSSARVGMIEDREFYKACQRLFIDLFLNPLFWRWYLRKYEAGTFDRMNIEPIWVGRRWDWVDPLKDVEAVSKQLDLGLVSYSEVLAQQGKDIEEHFDEITQERNYLKQKGLILPFGLD